MPYSFGAKQQITLFFHSCWNILVDSMSSVRCCVHEMQWYHLNTMYQVWATHIAAHYNFFSHHYMKKFSHYWVKLHAVLYFASVIGLILVMHWVGILLHSQCCNFFFKLFFPQKLLHNCITFNSFMTHFLWKKINS